MGEREDSRSWCLGVRLGGCGAIGEEGGYSQLVSECQLGRCRTGEERGRTLTVGI